MSDNRKYYDLKLKENFYNSETMVILESMQDGLLYSNLLLKMYLMSLKSGGILMLNDHLPHTPQTIATFTRHQVGTVERALKVFLEFGLVEILTDGAYYMTDIQLLIGQSSTEGERKKKERMRLKRQKLLPSGGADICPPYSQGDICPPEIRDKRLDIRDKSILLNGGEDRPILCKVYTGLTMEQEALLFAEQNGHSAPLSAGIKLRAKVVGGDAPSKAFVAATNRVGLSLNYDSMQLSDYRISCVGTALKLYDQLGEEIYCEALRHIVAAWEGRPDSFRAAVLRGVMYFVQLYHGQYSAERLVRALGGVHPMELYRISRDNPAKLPGWRRYVYPIYTTYNGKCRKDALPMKF